MIVCTAKGQPLGAKHSLRLREKELAPLLAEYQQLPSDQRKPSLEDPAKAIPPRRPMPAPPESGLVLRAHCTYLRRADDDKFVHSKEYYYRENPDRWAAETQSDMLWLTEAERRSLIPADPKAGAQAEVALAIQRRFFSTIGIDFMEGSVNSLPPRETSMRITVEQVTDRTLALRLDGYGHLGKELDEKLRKATNSRGCEIRVLGRLTYDRRAEAFTRFDIVGVGQAWGNKMDYVGREIRIDDYPWMYGIACELVTGGSAIDRIPPYNLLHYGSAGPYFAGE